MKPDNPLAPYIPALEAVEGTDSEAGLDGFADAWAEATADPDQRQVQDDLSNEHLTWADVAVRRLRHDAQRRRPVGERIAGSL